MQWNEEIEHGFVSSKSSLIRRHKGRENSQCRKHEQADGEHIKWIDLSTPASATKARGQGRSAAG
jgi:hypothetical protein